MGAAVRGYRKGILEQVAAWIHQQSENFTTADVAARFRMPGNTASQVLTRLWRTHRVRRIQRGIYSAPSTKGAP